jgi:DNA polymerase III delta prime subunit
MTIVSATSTYLSACTTDSQFSPYADNIEHLSSLEAEAMLLVAAAHFRLKGEGEILEIPVTGDRIGTMAEAEAILNQHVALRRAREVATPGGVELGFVRFCNVYGLSDVERKIALLLYMTVFSSSFKAFRIRTIFGSDQYCSDWGDVTVTPPTLLAVVSRDLREVVENRKVFAVDATLDREGLIVRLPIRGDLLPLRLNRHLVRLITGDHNVYEQRYDGIVRESPSVDPERVVLPDGVKEELIGIARDFVDYAGSARSSETDAFFGYGTGLVLFFHGPSGTGKTMMAHAIAKSLGKEIFSIDMGEAEAECDIGGTINYLYREARFSDGIVFFDECDDVFTEGTPFSRQLLIDIERSRVITILATNRPRTLDPAMERRITRIVNFPPPGLETREELWKTLLPPFASYSSDVNLAAIALDYPLSGGHIKNAILSAVREVTRTMVTPAGQYCDPVYLNERILRRAASAQAHRSLDAKAPGVTFLPEESIGSLRFGEKAERKIRNLAAMAKEAREAGNGLNIYIAASDPKVGIKAMSAIANACHLWVRVAPIDDTLTVGQESFRDPERQVPIGALAYLFCSAHWDNTVTVITGIKDVKGKESNGMALDQLGPLVPHLQRSRGINALIGPLPKGAVVPAGIDYVLHLDTPSIDNQLARWMHHVRVEENSLAGEQLIRIVERHPMHIDEIDAVACLAKTIARIEGDRIPTPADVEEALRRHRPGSSKMEPVLFGEKTR